jgi:hypothetical protein
MPAKKIVWNSRDALFGLALAVPGAVVILSGHVKPEIALLVGVLAAAGVEVPPTRKRRISIFSSAYCSTCPSFWVPFWHSGGCGCG